MIHFAALKSVGESCKLPLKYYQNNITGSTVLMNVMTEFGVKKIIFSSSATVYGDPKNLPLDENHEIGKYTYLFLICCATCEITVTQPLYSFLYFIGGCTNPYGKTKYMMEEIITDTCLAANVSQKILLPKLLSPSMPNKNP